ncbi:hypothetical protein K1T71_010569 [Dendrolimus kikuchii]|uniref:Uncharacterized protein n=1 Tax=Dendrolimus kikuchii TaxID=765133 RepID=A0ACC1CP88_9NEOP|nr:hypothetical protein K1T71_010569 [Dendrolimus kikuchii]
MPSVIVSLESGVGIQVITPGPEHTFTLDEENVSRLLLRDDVKDRVVVVISVAGAYRKGKSFLLDFFLRYMHHKYTLGDDCEDWLGPTDQPLKGFSWRGGSERHTTGMLLWSQPFKATLRDGTKAVILLMDTQGTFDSESTVRENSTVFALSTMISSVQIYNLSQNIEEDDLQHLQLFTDYGKLAQEQGSKNKAGKPFQKLQFVIRDWSCPYEYAYGPEGGERLLKKRLEVHKGQHEELQNLRVYINQTYEDLACFLMPHPGLKVSTNPEFDGKITDIRSQFQESLKELIPMLLAPENLVPKLIGGQPVKAKDLLTYFKVYMKVFNGSKLPEPKSILAATAEANNLSAVAEAREVYETLMKKVCGGTKPYLQPHLLDDEHGRNKCRALHTFHSKNKMGGRRLADGYEAKLVEFNIDYSQVENWSALFCANENDLNRKPPLEELTQIKSQEFHDFLTPLPSWSQLYWWCLSLRKFPSGSSSLQPCDNKNYEVKTREYTSFFHHAYFHMPEPPEHSFPCLHPDTLFQTNSLSYFGITNAVRERHCAESAQCSHLDRVYSTSMLSLPYPTLASIHERRHQHRSLGIVDEDMKQLVTVRFFSRLKKVLNCLLSGGNKIRAFNSWVMPSLAYSFGILRWTQTELDALDRRVRCILTTYRMHHPRSSVMINAKDLHNREVCPYRKLKYQTYSNIPE